MSRAFDARYLRSDCARVGRQRQRATVCARVIGPFLDIRICRETRQRPITRPITAPSRCQRRPFVQNLSWVANQENQTTFLGLQTAGDAVTIERKGEVGRGRGSLSFSKVVADRQRGSGAGRRDRGGERA